MATTSFHFFSPQGYDITCVVEPIGDDDCFVEKIVYNGGDEELFIRRVQQERLTSIQHRMRSGPIQHRAIRPPSPKRRRVIPPSDRVLRSHVKAVTDLVDWSEEM